MPFVAVDMDGTLIERTFCELRPTPYLGAIKRLGRLVRICSNGGGIACRLARIREERGYPDWPGVVRRLRTAMRLSGISEAYVALWHPEAPLPSGKELSERAREIGLPVIPPFGFSVRVPEGIIVASWSPEWRKPSPGMLKGLPRPLVFVGDEECDRLAAEAAGATFVHVSELIRG